MVYYMGDIHGNPLPAVFACRQMNMTHEDTLVLLGDVGAKEPLNKSPSFSAERENRRLPLGSSDSVGK